MKVDRLARSTVQFWSLVQELEAKGAGLRILNLGGDTIDTTSEARQLILAVLPVCPFEHDMMCRTSAPEDQEGQTTGVFAGRKPTAMPKADEIRRLRNEGLGANGNSSTLKIDARPSTVPSISNPRRTGLSHRPESPDLRIRSAAAEVCPLMPTLLNDACVSAHAGLFTR